MEDSEFTDKTIKRLLAMSVGSLAQSDVVTAERDVSLQDLATTLDEENVGAVVIVDSDEPVGVVTDRDIALAVSDGGDVSDVTASDVMPDDVATLEADAESIELARTIGEAKVRRIPVVDDTGSLEGLVTLDDLVATIGEQLEEVADVIEAQSPDYSP